MGSRLKRNLKLVVLDENQGQNIFGLDWSDVFSLTSKGTSALDCVSSTTRTLNSINLVHCSDRLDRLKSKYSSLFSSSLGKCTKTRVSIHLKAEAKPVFCKPRPLPFSRKLAVQTELNRLVDQGILERVDFSTWAAPIVVVTKPNGSVRICGDFKALNQQIQVDQHPLPSLDEILEKLQGGTIFSKIDLADAYFQLELDDESKKVCVINTPFGLFSYQRMCFGVASSPANFQRCIDSMLSGLPGVAGFIDDIIVTGIDVDDHFRNLNLLFDRLRDYGFTVRTNKCEFFKNTVEYLGHVIDKDGKRPSESSIQAIKQLPKPQDLRQLQAFLGKVNYYRHFIAHFSDKAASLNALLKKGARFDWSPECDDAFLRLRAEIVEATQLAHYDASKKLTLATDASQFGIGVVLSIDDNGKERPVAHASKTLTKSQKAYSQIEKEALSIIYGVTKFRQFLYGREFTLITDHKPLLAIFSPDKTIPTLTAQRLQRWALTLMAYRYDIRYKPTDEHGNADCLSRLPLGPDSSFDKSETQENEEVIHVLSETFDGLPVTHEQIREVTLKDNNFALIKKCLNSGIWPHQTGNTELTWFAARKHSIAVHDDVLFLQNDGFSRVIVPNALRSRLLSLLHDSHWGISKMKQMSRRYIVWPSLNRDIENLVKSCDACRRVSKSPDQQYRDWPRTKESFERIHLDFAGPVMNKMFLVAVDAHSKYPFVTILDIGMTTSKRVIASLREIFSLEGLPVTIVTDGGPQFTSNEFEDFCSKLGICHIVSPSFHPASNGEAERFVQTLKQGLAKNHSPGEDISAALCNLLATYRCTPHPSLDWKTPAEALHGRQPRNLLTLCSAPAKSHTTKFNSKSNGYKLGSMVYARNYKRGVCKWVPGTVEKILGRVVFLIKTDHGIWRRHRNQLQPRLCTTSKPATEPTVSAPARQPARDSFIPSQPSTSTAVPSRRYPLRDRKQTEFYRPT